MKRIDIRRGLDVLPTIAVADSAVPVAVQSVALVGRDYPRIKPTLAVSEGDRVALGDVLFADRIHPELRFCAAASGRVKALHRGARRSLQAVVVEVDDDADEAPVSSSVDDSSADAVRATLLAAGLWPALRARPYEAIPKPNAPCTDLFVTAMDTHPLAADPLPLIRRNRETFEKGVEALSRLAARTFVCMGPAGDVPCPERPQVTPVTFAGPHPAGLPGTHISYLAPDADGAWHVGYQDVIAAGHLFLTGRLRTTREVMCSGPGLSGPRLVVARLGAALADLVGDAADDGSVAHSGSLLAERSDALIQPFLGRYHNQVYVPGDDGRAGASGWRSGMLAVEAFDRVWPLRVPPAPLLRALLTQDTVTARRLGAAMLSADDLALCSYVCPARLDYGVALHDTQHELRRGA